MADLPGLDERLCHGRAWHDRWIGQGGWKGMGGFIFPINDLLHFPVITHGDFVRKFSCHAMLVTTFVDGAARPAVATCACLSGAGWPCRQTVIWAGHCWNWENLSELHHLSFEVILMKFFGHPVTTVHHYG